MKRHTTIALLALITATAFAAEPGPALMPLPQKMEQREGVFRLQPKTPILVEPASQAAGQFLADALRKATGHKPPLVSSTNPRTVRRSRK